MKDWYNKANLIITVKGKDVQIMNQEREKLNMENKQFHDTTRVIETAVEAVKILIPELQKKGYQFVTVSEMEEYKGVKLKAGKLYCNFR